MDAIYRELIGEDPPKRRGRPPKPKTDTPTKTPEHRPRNRSATQDPVYLDAKIRRENAAALKIELQNAAARRELLPVKAVEAEWASILRDVRGAMLALPSRLQQQLPHLSAHDVATIDREIRDALSELAERSSS